MGVLYNSNAVSSVGGNPPRQRIYKFGVFELRTETGELSKSGIRIRLQTRPCQVLQALLERPGELVKREELCARLWSTGTFVDFESGLNTATNRLRSALGDSADAPRYIETLPRLGYRFICPVTEVNGADAQAYTTPPRPVSEEQVTAATTPPTSVDSPRRKVTAIITSQLRSRKTAVFAAFLIAMLILLTWYLRSAAAGHNPQHVFQQLTFHKSIMRAARAFAPHSYPLLVQPF